MPFQPPLFEGDLLLFLALGPTRAAKYWNKSAEGPVVPGLDRPSEGLASTGLAKSHGHPSRNYISAPSAFKTWPDIGGYVNEMGQLDLRGSPYYPDINPPPGIESSLKDPAPPGLEQPVSSDIGAAAIKRAPRNDLAAASQKVWPFDSVMRRDYYVRDKNDSTSEPGFAERNWPYILGAGGLGLAGYLAYQHYLENKKKEEAAVGIAKQSDVAYDQAMSAGDQAAHWMSANPHQTDLAIGQGLGGLLAMTPMMMALRGGYSAARAPKGYFLQSGLRGAGIGMGAGLGSTIGGVGHAIMGSPDDLGTNLLARAAGGIGGGLLASQLLGPGPSEEKRKAPVEKVPENNLEALLALLRAQNAKTSADLSPGAPARADVPKKDFALPKKKDEAGEKGSYPIPDKAHARAALGFAAMHHGKGSATYKAVRAKVSAKFGAAEIQQLLKQAAPVPSTGYRFPSGVASGYDKPLPPTHLGVPSATAESGFGKTIAPHPTVTLSTMGPGDILRRGRDLPSGTYPVWNVPVNTFAQIRSPMLGGGVKQWQGHVPGGTYIGATGIPNQPSYTRISSPKMLQPEDNYPLDMARHPYPYAGEAPADVSAYKIAPGLERPLPPYVARPGFEKGSPSDTGSAGAPKLAPGIATTDASTFKAELPGVNNPLAPGLPAGSGGTGKVFSTHETTELPVTGGPRNLLSRPAELPLHTLPVWHVPHNAIGTTAAPGFANYPPPKPWNFHVPQGTYLGDTHVAGQALAVPISTGKGPGFGYADFPMHHAPAEKFPNPYPAPPTDVSTLKGAAEIQQLLKQAGPGKYISDLWNEHAQPIVNNIVGKAVDAKNPLADVSGFMDRNPWAYAPLIGGGIGAGVGLLGGLTGNRKKRDVLGSMLSGGLLGAGAGGLAWGARELMGDGAAGDKSQQAASTPLAGVGGRGFVDPSRGASPGLIAPKQDLNDAFTQSGQTNTFNRGRQEATNAAGGLMGLAARSNHPEDYNRLLTARNNALQDVIGPDGKPVPGVVTDTRNLNALNREIGEKYRTPVENPLDRIGNANALSALMGVATPMGVGAGMGPAAQADLDAAYRAAPDIGVDPTPRPSRLLTPGAVDFAAGATGSALARGAFAQGRSLVVDPTREKARQLASLFETPPAPKRSAPGASARPSLPVRAATAANDYLNPASGLGIAAPLTPQTFETLRSDPALVARLQRAAANRGIMTTGGTVPTIAEIEKSLRMGGGGPVPASQMRLLAEEVGRGKHLVGPIVRTPFGVIEPLPERGALGRMRRGPRYPELFPHRAGLSSRLSEMALSPLKPKNLLAGALTSLSRHAIGQAAPNNIINDLAGIPGEAIMRYMAEHGVDAETARRALVAGSLK